MEWAVLHSKNMCAYFLDPTFFSIAGFEGISISFIDLDHGNRIYRPGHSSLPQTLIIALVLDNM